MGNYKIILQYDGTDYNGWQRLKGVKNTIQGRLERIVSEMTGEETEVIGSGRTDAGVHALGQVANFHTKADFEAEYVKSYINTYLPKDIALIKAEAVNDRFHSRFNAKSKTYVYRIWNDIVPNVFENRFVYSYPKALDVAAMREAAGKLVGKHDFMAFCSNHRTKKSTVRTIYAADVEEIGNEIRIVFRGDGFLYNMARIMAGTILQSGSGEFDPSAIDGVFESRKRETAGNTLPAKGLILEKVEYD